MISQASPRLPCASSRTIRLMLRILSIALLLFTSAILVLAWLTGATDTSQNALNNDSLPYYVQKSWQPRWDRWASWQKVSGFNLVDQHGQPVDASLLHGKPGFVGFFYTGCVTLCPVSLEVLRALKEQIQARKLTSPQFTLLTITPEQDDARAMAAYAQRLKLPADWHMLSGQRQQMQKLTGSLMTDIDARAANGEPLHGQRAFLLDAKARVRGIYDASSMVEMRRMAGDYERLLAAPE